MSRHPTSAPTSPVPPGVDSLDFPPILSYKKATIEVRRIPPYPTLRNLYQRGGRARAHTHTRQPAAWDSLPRPTGPDYSEHVGLSLPR